MTTELHMTIADSAVTRLNEMRAQQSNANLLLRVTVLGGGCAGFKYQLDFDDKKEDGDEIFRDAVITDADSLPFLQNAEIYYETSLMGAAFKIKNPNAASSCGCGKSFSTRM